MRLQRDANPDNPLLPGIALSALGALAFLTAGSLPLLFAGRVLAGLSAGVFTGTATATLIDFAPPDQRARATLVATVANMGGLGWGPLLSGVLSQWAGSPLRLTFWIDLALLVPAAVGIWAMPEPVATQPRAGRRLQLPRVPASLRLTFVEAGLAGFAGFAVLGLAAGCGILIAGMGLLALSLGLSSLPVIGEGALAQLTGLRPAGLAFAAVVAALSATALVLISRTRGRRIGSADPARRSSNPPKRAMPAHPRLGEASSR